MTTKSAKTDFPGSTDSLAIQDPLSKFLISLFTFLFTPETTITCSLQEWEIPSAHDLLLARPYNSFNKFFLNWVLTLLLPQSLGKKKT